LIAQKKTVESKQKQPINIPEKQKKTHRKYKQKASTDINKQASKTAKGESKPNNTTILDTIIPHLKDL
jgi:hypothetical protein